MVVDEEQEVTNYLSVLQQRLKRLEGTVAELVTAQHLHEVGVENEHRELARLVRSLSSELAEVEHHVESIKKETMRLIGAFRDAARQPQLNRLQQRVDAWKGEQFITRNEFRRLLETQSF